MLSRTPIVLWSFCACSITAFSFQEGSIAGSPSSSIGTKRSTDHFDIAAASFDAENATTSLEQPLLTVLIPAFNEELRIRSTLEDIDAYFANSAQWKQARVLVASDGSTDATSSVVQSVNASSTVPMECIHLPKNEGKGAALSFGLQHIYNRQPNGLILTADADGSGEIACLENLYATMNSLLHKTKPSWGNEAMVVGYRTEKDKRGSRMGLRKGFRWVVRTIVGDLGVSDSQCGFKLMTATAGNRLYSDLALKGWSHDVEVLYKCRQLGIPLAEAEVFWQDKAGSKLVSSPGGIGAVTLQMLLDVLSIRLYWSRKWNSSGE
ncbi:hypothetical protein MPSEU_001101400 [Mayamaea pseudoterrestris]|nr:hypothetical protein MPSEU_001101400 [Mayamaea pseudoterrestris]